jgi:hypothetical protein
VPKCCYIRMHADHTLLLEVGEAFLAHDNALNAKMVIAMRSPSYFAGDLRKLKLVDTYTLSERALRFQEPEGLKESLRRTAVQRYEFFKNVRNVLILSCRGSRSEADRMSGGDYDGDKAWICWSDTLVSRVETATAQDTSKYIVKKEHQEQKPFWETTPQDTLNYYYNFRFHQSHLGRLSENLDKYIDLKGFDHEWTEDLGRASFLQVRIQL